MDKQPAKTITLDLSQIDVCSAFAAEVLLRLAFFSVKDNLSEHERSKAVHRAIDLICSALHKQMREKYSTYLVEYAFAKNLESEQQGERVKNDNSECDVPGPDSPDNSTEQVGC